MNDGSGIGEFIERAVDRDDIEDMLGHSSVVCSADPGNPVIFVSEEFQSHTGYSPSEAVGRNLSFLQGPDTEPASVAQFRDLIAKAEAGIVRITNYRADGTKFVHECDFRPVRDTEDRVTHFIAIQRLVNG
jgi:PAS domain S-box-containing protein